MTRVFLCYQRVTTVYVEQIVAYLERNKIDVYYDQKNDPGINWHNRLVEELISCRCVIILIEPEWQVEEHSWVYIEIMTALEHHIPLLPICIDRDIPKKWEAPDKLNRLFEYQALFLYSNQAVIDVHQFDGLIKAINQLPERPRIVEQSTGQPVTLTPQEFDERHSVIDKLWDILVTDNDEQAVLDIERWINELDSNQIYLVDEGLHALIQAASTQGDEREYKFRRIYKKVFIHKGRWFGTLSNNIYHKVISRYYRDSFK